MLSREKFVVCVVLDARGSLLPVRAFPGSTCVHSSWCPFHVAVLQTVTYVAFLVVCVQRNTASPTQVSAAISPLLAVLPGHAAPAAQETRTTWYNERAACVAAHVSFNKSACSVRHRHNSLPRIETNYNKRQKYESQHCHSDC